MSGELELTIKIFKPVSEKNQDEVFFENEIIRLKDVNRGI